MDTNFDYSTLEASDVEFTGPQFEVTEDSIPDNEPDKPSPELASKRKRTARAKRYEARAAEILGAATRAAVEHPATVPDGAALLYYGKNFAEKMGDLADADERVRKALDAFSGGIENPYAAAFSSAAILALQIIRNHEPKLEPEVRGLRIPFTKKTFKFRFGIKLGRIRPLTHDPKALTVAALTPDVISFLESQGVRVAISR